MVNGVGEIIAIIDILTESLDLDPREKKTQRYFINSFLNTRFIIEEDPEVQYPMLEAKPYSEEGVIRAPVIEGEEQAEKLARFSEYQKFFFPALCASRLTILRELHQWFVSTADKKALEAYKEKILLKAQEVK